MPVANIPFLGLRASDNFVADARPKNWREGILRLYPNGMAPLTALTALLGSEKVDDPEFNWWVKPLPIQGGTVTGVYTDSGLTTGYTSGGTAGATEYIKMAEADAKQVKAGHIVLLSDLSNYKMTVNARVTAVTLAGASSYLTVKLLEADDNGTTTDLSDCDRFDVIGSAHEEGAARPNAIAYDPTKVYNYTQIFRNSLEMTRTARKTRLRTGEQYKEAKREALELHSMELEKAWLFGIPTEGSGETLSNPLRTTGGLIHFIKTYASGNIFDYPTDSATTWLTGGMDWLNEKLEVIFRYGDTEKMAFCGNGALLGINRLAMNKGDFTFTTETTSFGIQVTNWVTPFGTLKLKTHPLFINMPQMANDIIVFEPRRLKYRYIDDTFFKADDRERKGGETGADKMAEEYLTEAGLEFHHPETCGILHGVGLTGE